jgi:hypothetical protein
MNSDAREIAEMVPLNLLRRYLKAKGWRIAEPQSPPPGLINLAASADTTTRDFFKSRSTGKRNVDLYILSENGLPEVELVVPKDRNTSDFDRRIQGAILTLSQVASADPSQVIASVRSIGFDVVRSRIPDDLVFEDTIHLENAKNYINGMKDLLAATATTEIKPLPFYGRPYKEATDYSDKCRFGHTYRGSFGFTIESPITPNEGDSLFPVEPTPPFERRVVQRLAIGIQQVCDAVTADNPEPLVNGFRSGFSANGCERFAKLIYETAYSGMSFLFSFSPEWTVSEMVAKSAEYEVGPRHVEMARAAAETLRGASLGIPIDVYGMVVRLQNEADPSDLSGLLGEGEISVLYANEDRGDIHVRATLPPTDYLKAVEAHRLGRPVSITGTLVRRGRYWYLDEPGGLTIHHQPDLGLQ